MNAQSGTKAVPVNFPIFASEYRAQRSASMKIIPVTFPQPQPRFDKQKASAMPQTALAVIGAGYGDEGKGLAVDALASRLIDDGLAVTVVRSNGGAQAGHTVITPGGKRHVHHHVGAGQFVGASTHLSQFFVAHPMMLIAEIQELTGISGRPDISIDPRAAVTTPWDMLLNQIVETARDAGRHGSCGLGFGETLERMERGPRLTVADLASEDLAERLEQISLEWFPKRLAELGVQARLPGHLDAVVNRKAILARFLEDCADFRAAVRIRDDADLAQDDAVIFEGAQGLALDMDLGAFPHVTRSHTGLPNMAAICAEAGIEQLEVHYMTRAYATRHGAGPLAGEELDPGVVSLDDPTNQPNAWQGRLRLAPLDPGLLGGLIDADLQRGRALGLDVDPCLAVTCLDQVSDPAQLIGDGVAESVSADELAERISAAVGLPLAFVSRGPCRADVEFMERAPMPADGLGRIETPVWA